SAAKRKVREGRKTPLTLPQEPVRIECLRFREPARVVLTYVWKELDEGVLRKWVAGDFYIGHCLSRENGIRRRIQPQRLLYHSFEIGQMRDVVHRRLSTRKNPIELLMNERCHPRVSCQAIEKPDQAGCSGVVARDQQGHGLIAGLLIRETTTVTFFIHGE